MGYNDRCNVSELLGKTLESVTQTGSDDDIITFVCVGGETFRMLHDQDCCEHVRIEDINGDLNNLVGSPITMADESSSDQRPADVAKPEWEPESQTWTFYKFATIKGYVDIRWLGTSNGYYSERVNFERVTP